MRAPINGETKDRNANCASFSLLAGLYRVWTDVASRWTLATVYHSSLLYLMLRLQGKFHLYPRRFLRWSWHTVNTIYAVTCKYSTLPTLRMISMGIRLCQYLTLVG